MKGEIYINFINSTCSTSKIIIESIPVYPFSLSPAAIAHFSLLKNMSSNITILSTQGRILS